MTLAKSKFSDATYRDFIRCNPLHYNSMRANPMLPQGFIENNMVQVRPFSRNWRTTIGRDDDDNNNSEGSKLSPAKRCLFSDNRIHLATLSTLTNQHLLDDSVREDHLKQTIGSKRRIVDPRNGIGMRTHGDKSYRDVEYSQEFFSRSAREWRGKRDDDINQKSNEPINSNLSNISLDYELDKNIKIEEVNNVINLDNWKPAPRLQKPFKVLDLPAKSPKYRPKVTK